MTTLKPLDIELVKPDNHSDPLPPQSQDVLIDVLFGDDKQKVSHTHDNQTTQTSDNQTDARDNGEADNKTFTTVTVAGSDDSDSSSGEVDNKKVSQATHDPAGANMKKVSHEGEMEKVSQASDEVLTTTPVQKRKAGRPKGSKNKKNKNSNGVIRLVPSSIKAITRLNKDSKFYVHAYSQSLSVEEIVAIHSTPVRRTASEQFALNLLVGVAKNDPKSVDRYWQIVGKEAKSPEIAPKTRTNTSLLDDILTSVEGEIFGENVDATTPDNTSENANPPENA